MKKILSVLMAALLLCGTLLSLASCGGSGEPVLKVIDIPLTDEEYAFCVQPGNDELLSSLNAFLAASKTNGTFDDIVDNYFGDGTPVGHDMGTVGNRDNQLVIATNTPFEPFEYIGDDGKIYGLDIEIAAAYAKSKGLTLVIKNIGFDDIFTQVDAGYADIGMAGITVSEDRAALYDFTTTYFNASQKLIVAGDNTDFDGCTTLAEVEAVLAALEGKKVGYQNGTTGGMYVVGDEDWGYAGFANLIGKGYASAQDAVTDLINGNLYAVVVDEAPANAIVNAINN